MAYTLSPGILTWPVKSGLAVQGHASQEPFVITALKDFSWLSNLGETFEIEDLHHAIGDLGGVQASEVVNKLVESGTIVSSTMKSGYRYHESTRDYPFLDMSKGIEAMAADAAKMREYLQEDDHRPDPYLNIDGANYNAQVDLPRSADLSLEIFLHDELLELSGLLVGTFGEISKVPSFTDPTSLYKQMTLLHKSIPSGGSRHPLELFVTVNESPRLRSGKYHFNVQHNSLIPLEELGETNDSGAWDLTVEIAAYVERDMFRYRDARSFRAVLVDAGHADGQLAVLASFMNWDYQSSVHIDIDYGAAWMENCALPLVIKGTLKK